MGQVAAAGDNAAMESLWALLQTNVLDRRRWRTRAEREYAIIEWIEHTYNRRCRQRALGKLTLGQIRTRIHQHRSSSMITNNRCQPNRQQTRQRLLASFLQPVAKPFAIQTR